MTRFSDGDSAYFFDVMSPLYEKMFATESAADFKAFEGNNDKEIKAVVCPPPAAAVEGEPEPEPCVPEGPFITVASLNTSFEAFKWKTNDFKP